MRPRNEESGRTNTGSDNDVTNAVQVKNIFALLWVLFLNDVRVRDIWGQKKEDLKVVQYSPQVARMFQAI